jgi:predicted deacylase
MKLRSTKRPEEALPKPTLERVIGDIGDAKLGPTLVVIGGIHGNEPAGIEARRRVCGVLEAQETASEVSGAAGTRRVNGRFVALSGNLRALEAGRRYLERDLNRMWAPTRIAQLDAGAQAANLDEQELVELKRAIEGVLAEAGPTAYMVDFHTTSSNSAPFILFADTLRNRAFAKQFPLPLVLGLEEQVDGALLDLYDARGVVTMGVEGGQHDDADAIDHLESVLWIALVASGVMHATDVAGLSTHRRRLRRARGGVPGVVEVRFRHAIDKGDDFRMEPGFTNFQPIRKGDLLAHDKDGAILARESGRILMPLYQGQGNDGYFMTRAVQPIWLKISAFLRRRRFDILLPLLPGVRPDPTQAGTLLINTAIARLLPLQALHLLGYRKQRWVGKQLVVSRRRHDLFPTR